MEYGLIGKKLSHSFSEKIHSVIGDYGYSLLELDEKELSDFFQKKDFAGINVTIPYKEKVMPYLNNISEVAEKIGAVNTVVNENGTLSGFNTDFYGLTSLIKKAGIEICGKKVLILGTGGTAKTAKYVLETLHASRITMVSRTGKDGAVDYAFAKRELGDTDVIINCTPCGMFPEAYEAPINIDDFPHLSGVIDAIYNPIRTYFLQAAEKRGIKAIGGLYMLGDQARASAELFFKKKIPESVSEKIYEKMLTESQNIVLIGMPSSGKTTIGKILSSSLSRPFFDTDEEIEKSEGMRIREIFEKKGEGYFRGLEKKTVQEISKKNGFVIAVGGGTVLDPENVMMLKTNGVLFLIDTPSEKLFFTKSRPLFDSAEKKEILYRERKETYLSAKDFVIENKSTPENAAKEIEKVFFR